MRAPSSSWLRIAVVQFAPKLGEVHANIAKARELCRGLTPRSVDLVCFPEMIFTGYMFPDAPSIAPYLEHPRTGPTSMFCAELARHLRCYVVAGFPERLEPPASVPTLTPAPSTPSVPSSLQPSPIGANTALLHDPTGQPIHTYHKSNLFPTDLTWARPGPGFTTLDLPMPIGRIALAICNDLNVCVNVGGGGGVWHSIEEGPYELAEFCRREGVRVLVVLNAWLKSKEEVVEGGDSGDRAAGADTDGNGGLEDANDPHDSEEEVDDDDGSEPNWRLLNYWAMRLRPLWAEDVDMSVDGTPAGEITSKDREERGASPCLVVICNRFGRERGKTFAGSSAMFVTRAGSGRPGLMHVMGEREEGVAVWTARIGSDPTLA